jgi:hypothetical protein
MWYAGASAGIRIGDIVSAVSKNIAAGLCSIASLFLLLEYIHIFKDAWINLLVKLCSVCVTYIVLLISLYRKLSPWHQITDVILTFLRPVLRKASEAN